MPITAPVEVTVIAYGGRILRRAACALGIHKAKTGPAPEEAIANSIRFCIWCGESDDARWSWVGTDHRYDLGRGVSLVRYREAVA